MPTAFSEKLPCDLSPSERALKSSELALKIREHGELHAAKKESTARFGKLIKESDKKITELATEVRDGVEYREVACTERVDFAGNQVEILRMDDGTVARTRPLTSEEKQAQLFDASAYSGRSKGRRRKPDDSEEDESAGEH